MSELITEAQREKVALELLSKIVKESPFAGKVFMAGGGVRDEIMGRDVKDIDLVVAMPDGGIEFAKWITQKLGVYHPETNPIIFPRFGTAKFNLRGVKVGGIDLSDLDIEAVMTRGEEYTPGSRKPTVAYADLKKDAERRDFTVNDLYHDLATGKILDPTGKGIADIKAGIIRTPTDPDITFKDDPLRMLRAIRFVTKYDWKMPFSLVKALIKNAPMLQHISTERIQEEFNKMLMTSNPDKAIKMLALTGLLKQFCPELDALRGIKQNKYHDDDVFGHTLSVVKNTPPDLKARIAAVFHDIGKPMTLSIDPETQSIHFYDHEDVGAKLTKEILHRLKYPNDFADSVVKIVEHHMRLKTVGDKGEKASDKGLRKFAARLGDDLDSAFAVMHADNLSHSEGHTMPDQIPALKQRIQTLAQSAPVKPKLPINGNDLMQTFNLQPGPHLKTMLKAVEDAWFEDPTMGREKALAVAKDELDKSQGMGSSSESVMNMRVMNPYTGNSILVKTALEYEPDHPARQEAENILKQKKQ